MVELAPSGVWLYRGLFVLIAAVLMFTRLLPMGSEAGDWPGPDLLLCVIFAWATRRPDYLPVWLLGAVLLMEDMLLMRPPGLWTALVIVAVEFIRNRVTLTRELTFMVEWALVAALMVACLLAYRLVFTLSFLPQAGFGFAMMQTLWSILCYPLVVGASRITFDLRKPATGEVDSYGRRL
ncbi:rod shape-determining protein MreD [Pseudotabrizicola sp. L79]|uniref:rod shape-determining protein MreD n=1 Tax=Pseudotabrizicola sp. L79 TaxID=3118402 RepID=UPI002F955F60